MYRTLRNFPQMEACRGHRAGVRQGKRMAIYHEGVVLAILRDRNEFRSAVLHMFVTFVLHSGILYPYIFLQLRITDSNETSELLGEPVAQSHYGRLLVPTLGCKTLGRHLQHPTNGTRNHRCAEPSCLLPAVVCRSLLSLNSKNYTARCRS